MLFSKAIASGEKPESDVFEGLRNEADKSPSTRSAPALPLLFTIDAVSFANASNLLSNEAAPRRISRICSSVNPFILPNTVCADWQYRHPLIWLVTRFTTSLSLPLRELLRF